MMKIPMLTAELSERMEKIYGAMETAYDAVAAALHFGCQGCPDNCCDSYFLHHTYIEWSYLWQGVDRLASEKKEELLDRANEHVRQATLELQQGRRPQIMCPLNEKGLCILYRHRLMVCRTHGVPATLLRPDGQKIQFPGCFRCQELVGNEGNAAVMDRTSLLRQLALLENDLLAGQRQRYPKVKLTIAQMLVQGPPQLSPPLSGRGPF